MPAPVVIALLILAALAALAALAFARRQPALAVMAVAAAGIAHAQFGLEPPRAVSDAVARVIHPAAQLHDEQVQNGAAFGCQTASDPGTRAASTTRAFAGDGCR